MGGEKEEREKRMGRHTLWEVMGRLDASDPLPSFLHPPTPMLGRVRRDKRKSCKVRKEGGETMIPAFSAPKIYIPYIPVYLNQLVLGIQVFWGQRVCKERSILAPPIPSDSLAETKIARSQRGGKRKL